MPYKNIEDKRKCSKRWRERNPNYSKNWYKKHPNYQRNYYFINAEKLRKYIREYLRKHYKSHYKKYKEQGAAQAKWAVKNAIQTGKLLSLSKNYIKCSDCNKRAIHYDHRDYNKPLDVEPICRSCNRLRGKAIYLIKEETNA